MRPPATYQEIHNRVCLRKLSKRYSPITLAFPIETAHEARLRSHEARVGSIPSLLINVRIIAVRKLTVEAADKARGLPLDWSPFLRQTVKTHFSANGELSHGVVTQAVHAGV